MALELQFIRISIVKLTAIMQNYTKKKINHKDKMAVCCTISKSWWWIIEQPQPHNAFWLQLQNKVNGVFFIKTRHLIVLISMFCLLSCFYLHFYPVICGSFRFKMNMRRSFVGNMRNNIPGIHLVVHNTHNPTKIINH